MSQSPIPRVLSAFRSSDVRALLMGGQACILYGGAEFSRDIDFVILSADENLERLGRALRELKAEVIAVPPFDRTYLERGHAVHFRSRHPEAEGFRIDVMSRLRGVGPFEELWRRRTSFELPGAGEVEALALPDLVASKKTQRDKDWVMIRRLVEASYARYAASPNPERVAFWLRECRTVEILLELARSFAAEATVVAETRTATAEALRPRPDAVRAALAEEVARERALDQEYWRPLRAELEELCRERKRP